MLTIDGFHQKHDRAAVTVALDPVPQIGDFAVDGRTFGIDQGWRGWFTCPVQNIVRRHVQNARDRHQARRRNPIATLFVFLKLLKADAECLGDFGL